MDAEIKIPIGSRILCFETHEANNEGCSYIRITDEEGKEIAYWDYEEWVESPQEVMGAIMGAITAEVNNMRNVL